MEEKVDFMFQLSKSEVPEEFLKSKNSTLNEQGNKRGMHHQKCDLLLQRCRKYPCKFPECLINRRKQSRMFKTSNRALTLLMKALYQIRISKINPVIDNLLLGADKKI